MGSLESDFDGLKMALFEHCDRKDTGTLFVATDDNRSAQIVLFKGTLQGVACSGECNSTALKALASLTRLKFSFTPELIYPVPETLLPEQGQALLEVLGYQPGRTVTAAPEPTPSPRARSSTPRVENPHGSVTLRVYRGQVIRG